MYVGLTLVGNLTADPEMRYTKNGKPVCNFTVAANPAPDVTRYFEVTVWNKLAETCQQFLHRGRTVLVICSDVEANAYMSRGGEAKAALKVTSHLVKFIGKGKTEVATGSEAYDEGDGHPEVDFYATTGDIPF